MYILHCVCHSPIYSLFGHHVYSASWYLLKCKELLGFIFICAAVVVAVWRTIAIICMLLNDMHAQYFNVHITLLHVGVKLFFDV